MNKDSDSYTKVNLPPHIEKLIKEDEKRKLKERKLRGFYNNKKPNYEIENMRIENFLCDFNLNNK